VIIGLKDVLRKAADAVKTSLDNVEKAKKKVDDLMANKREHPGAAETVLQGELVSLQAREQEATMRLSAATARVLELEERMRSLKEARSLSRFLAERTRSEEYRKHLGLISIIRQDFESLGKRLEKIRIGSGDARAVDRIILFIDDLDRCPADKVLEVLQAVHLLLAYRNDSGSGFRPVLGRTDSRAASRIVVVPDRKPNPTDQLRQGIP
jgi:hypothetical protein